ENGRIALRALQVGHASVGQPDEPDQSIARVPIHGVCGAGPRECGPTGSGRSENVGFAWTAAVVLERNGRPEITVRSDRHRREPGACAEPRINGVRASPRDETPGDGTYQSPDGLLIGRNVAYEDRATALVYVEPCRHQNVARPRSHLRGPGQAVLRVRKRELGARVDNVATIVPKGPETAP